MKNYQYLQQKYLVNTYVNRGLTLVKGEGVYLYDENNHKYLDLMSNYGVNILGYNHPQITDTLISQCKNLIDLHCSFNNNARADASEALVKKCGPTYTNIYWSNSGAEANEAALKFAALASGKKKFIYCNHGYHGKTLGALSVSHGIKYRQPFEPLLWSTTEIDYNDPDSLEKAIDHDTAAFIMEPIQGESGIIPSKKGFLKKVKEICDKKGILLIFDEVQTGAGRTGKFLASQWEDVPADIITLGKGLAGGLPVGATIVNSKVNQKISKSIHTSTFGGNPLVCAAVVTVLNLLDDQLLKHVTEIGNYFIEKLKTIKSDLIVDVRGQGLMIGVEVKDKRNEIMKKMQQNDILVIPAGENVVRFLPPYIIEKKHTNIATQTLEKILKEISN